MYRLSHGCDCCPYNDHKAHLSCSPSLFSNCKGRLLSTIGEILESNGGLTEKHQANPICGGERDTSTTQAEREGPGHRASRDFGEHEKPGNRAEGSGQVRAGRRLAWVVSVCDIFNSHHR
jgi:hypothetical protein